MFPGCQILATARSSPKSQAAVDTELVSPGYSSHDAGRNSVLRRISQDSRWDSPPIDHFEAFGSLARSRPEITAES